MAISISDGGRMNLHHDIATLDLDPIIYKLCLDEGWSLEKADNAVIRYRHFLQIIKDAEPGFEAAPTKEIDTVWHHHILDTQKYFEDTEKLFGRYLHHFPYSGVFGGEDSERQARRAEATKLRLNAISEENEHA